MAETFADFFFTKIESIRKDFPLTEVPENVQTADISFPKLESLQETSESRLKHLIETSNSKSCHLDPIPTSLLKECTDILLPLLCKIVNSSLASATVPNELKVATVTPTLKKPTLDNEDMKNYRPISNLPFLAKLIEKEVVSQLNNHMTSHGLHEVYQSAYKASHSTETALLKVQNDILQAIDQRECVMLVLLDLSAAFDTVDHHKLLHRLESSFGIAGTALQWLSSYLTGRSQSVHIKGISSKPRSLQYGVPQGSVIGPLGFITYSSPLGEICRHHEIMYHLYADDTQLYLAFTADDQLDKTQQLENCIEEIKQWMSSNFLKMNESKTEFLLLSSLHLHLKLTEPCRLNIGNSLIPSSTSARNIGAIFDSHMNMSDHISAVCRSCYLHIRNIGKIRPYLTQKATEQLIHAFISSKLDHLNSLLTGLPDYQIKRLQHIQNTAARIVTRSNKYQNITPVLISLHWLPVRYRIEYKIALLVYKCLHDLAPAYLINLITVYTPARSLRSGTDRLLTQPAARTVRYGERTFSYAAPSIWNALPKHLRLCDNFELFKRDLKTFLFKTAYRI